MAELLSFAYGEMGLSPSQLEEYTHSQFLLKADGFQKLRDKQEAIFRRMTGFIVSPQLDKKSKFDIEKVWPILSDKSKQEYRTEAMFSKEKIKMMMDSLGKDNK